MAERKLYVKISQGLTSEVLRELVEIVEVQNSSYALESGTVIRFNLDNPVLLFEVDRDGSIVLNDVEYKEGVHMKNTELAKLVQKSLNRKGYNIPFSSILDDIDASFNDNGTTENVEDIVYGWIDYESMRG